MNIREPFEPDEAFALDAYAALPPALPPHDLDARIRAAAHAANVARKPRRWATGLATAAVAVLAVGVAWRGLEWNRPEYAPSAAPSSAPTLQPAFKLETFESADRASEAKVEEAGARKDVQQPPAAPAMSSADWNDSSPGRVPATPAIPAPETETEAESVVEPLFDAPMPMAEPAPPPPPPAPPAPVVPTPMLEQATHAPMQDATTEARRQRPPSNPGRESSARADEASGGFGSVAGAQAPAEESDRLEAEATTPPVQAAGPAFVPEPQDQAAKRDSDAGTAPKSQRNEGEAEVGALSPRGIRMGSASYTDAVAAARAAHARGDLAAARELSAAIVARFGAERLPPDLRQLNP